MAYPQNGSMANGSRRRSPTVPSAAAVCSEEMVAPMKTPCAQDSASVTRGTLVALRPPKRIASTGTPAGSSHVSAVVGQGDVGEDRVAADHGKGRRVGLLARPRGDAEEARLGVDGAQPAVLSVRPHPGLSLIHI